MAGLDLFSIRVRAEAALSKQHHTLAQAPNIADPIPAARPEGGNDQLKVGYYAPAPVPAAMAHEFEAPSFKPNEGLVVDPIPARMA